MSGVWAWLQSVLSTLPRSVVTEIMRLSDEAPLRLLFEVAIVLIVLFLLFRHPYNPRSARLSKKEENALIDEWTPEPLLDSSTTRNAVKDEPAQVVESAADAVVKVQGEGDVLNWAASNFLGLATAKELKEDAAKAIVKYGVGSCGPRGFYGTLDIHLQLEEVMSKFFGATQSILYSDGLACLASVIPAFAKRDDLVVCDEGVNYAIQQGVQLSRSNVLTFKHNDMADLRRVLDSVREKDLKSGNTKLYRRFIVVEGLYQYHGDIAPLRDLIALKNEYRYRLVLDDSLALGVLGANGKGTYEHFGVDVNEVDIMCGVFDHTMSSVGGWCIGREPSVVDHQRLAGAGYCFSASSPPYTSAAGIASFGLLSRGGAQLVAQLRERSARMHAALHAQLGDLGVLTVNGVPAGRGAAAAAADVKDVKSSEADAASAMAPAISPVIHLRLARPLDAKSRAADKRVVDSVVRHMRRAGIAVVAPKYSENKQPEPSVRVMVTVLHDNQQIDATAKALRAAFRNALSEVVAADEKEIARLEAAAAEAAASASPRATAAAAGAGAGKKGGAAASSTAAAEEWLSDAHTKATLELTARLALLKPVLERVAEAEIAHAFGGAAAAAAGAGAGARSGSRAKRSTKAAAAAAVEETDGKAAAADAEEAAAAALAPAKRSSSRVRAAAAEADGAAAAAAVTPIRTRSASKGRAAAGAGSGKKKK